MFYGFKEIFISKSHEKENYNTIDVRLACIAKKNKEDMPSSYYEKQLKENAFIVGGSN